MDIYRKELTEDELVEMPRNRELDRFADELSNIILNSSQRAIDEVESEGESAVTAEPSLLEVSESGEVVYTSMPDDESQMDEDAKRHYNCWERNHILTFRVNDKGVVEPNEDKLEISEPEIDVDNGETVVTESSNDIFANAALGLLVSLSCIISDDYEKHQRMLRSKIDRKLSRAIDRKMQELRIKSDYGQSY